MSAAPELRKQLGDWGERMAGAYLCSRGYRMIESQWRCRRGEIDLIAKQNECLVIVEVKTRYRQSRVPAVEAVDLRKQNRLRLLARIYMALQQEDIQAIRFDVICVSADKELKNPHIEHYINAF